MQAPAAVKPPRVQDEKYFIYASTSGKQPSENVKVLESGTSTDKFVASLNKDQCIILSAKPEPTASFDGTDTTELWFTKIDPKASASLTLGANIESFVVQFEAPWPLIFSSAADVLLFTFGASPTISHDVGGARIPSPGLDTDGNMLTCGLDFTKTKPIESFTVKDLLKNSGLAGMTDLLPTGIPDMPVRLDKPNVGEPPSRNAIWFVPQVQLQVTVRLQFQLPAFDALQGLLGGALKGFTLKSANAVYRKQTVFATTENGDQPMSEGEVAFGVECSVQAGETGAPVVDMTAGVEFAPSGVNLTLLFTSENPLGGILRWLAWLIGDDTLEGFVNDLLNKVENDTKVFPDFNLRRLSVGLEYLTSKDQPVMDSFSFDIEVTASFGCVSESKPVVFLISYNWSRISGGFGALAGELWNGEYRTQLIRAILFSTGADIAAAASRL